MTHKALILVIGTALLAGIAGARAQVPAQTPTPAVATPAADPKAAATAKLQVAHGQMAKDRLQLKQDRKALEDLRKTGDRDKIDFASSRVRISKEKFNNSQAQWRENQQALAALEKPENEAAKARGDALRAQQAQTRAERAKVREERRVATSKAQEQVDAKKGAKKAAKDAQKPEQEAAQKRAEEIRADQQAQKDLNKAEHEQTAKIREQREAEHAAAKKKLEEAKKTPKKWYEFW